MTHELEKEEDDSSLKKLTVSGLDGAYNKNYIYIYIYIYLYIYISIYICNHNLANKQCSRFLEQGSVSHSRYLMTVDGRDSFKYIYIIPPLVSDGRRIASNSLN
jgi:hypothetical protein